MMIQQTTNGLSIVSAYIILFLTGGIKGNDSYSTNKAVPLQLALLTC